MNILLILFGVLYTIALSAAAAFFCDKFRSLVRTKGKSTKKTARIRH